MDNILKQTAFKVEPKLDLVVLSVGHAQEHYSFDRAFQLGLDILVHCNIAMQCICENPLQNVVTIDQARVKKLLDSIEIRETLKSSSQPRYQTKINHYDELIEFQIGNYMMRIHWYDALQLSVHIRTAAKAAKKWSGKRSMTFRGVGILTDASILNPMLRYGNIR